MNAVDIDRRALLRGAGVALGGSIAGWAAPGSAQSPAETLSGRDRAAGATAGYLRGDGAAPHQRSVVIAVRAWL